MARLFLEVLYAYRGQTGFRLHEFVLMADHFHLLLSVPPGTTVEKVVQLVKGGFSYRARRELGFGSEIWQRGFSDRYITDLQGFEMCRRYVRGNPLRARRVAHAEDYPYTSAHAGWELDAAPEHLGG